MTVEAHCLKFLWYRPTALLEMAANPAIIALFDVDGTLTAPRKVSYFLLYPYTVQSMDLLN